MKRAKRIIPQTYHTPALQSLRPNVERLQKRGFGGEIVLVRT